MKVQTERELHCVSVVLDISLKNTIHLNRDIHDYVKHKFECRKDESFVLTR